MPNIQTGRETKKNGWGIHLQQKCNEQKQINRRVKLK